MKERPLVDYNADRDEWGVVGDRPEFMAATPQNLALLIARDARFTDRALHQIGRGFV